ARMLKDHVVTSVSIHVGRGHHAPGRRGREDDAGSDDGAVLGPPLENLSRRRVLKEEIRPSVAVEVAQGHWLPWRERAAQGARAGNPAALHVPDRHLA